jgi:hypothetical protein
MQAVRRKNPRDLLISIAASSHRLSPAPVANTGANYWIKRWICLDTIARRPFEPWADDGRWCEGQRWC